MTPSSASLGRLYAVGTIFGLFGFAYGALGVHPGGAMRLCLGLGPGLAVAAWLAADTRRTHVAAVYDAGWLFAMGWPVAIPWYALRTRGHAGWWLAFQLYTIALAGQVGLFWGVALHLLVRR